MSVPQTAQKQPINIDGYEQLASSFHRDGYIVLSQLFSTAFTSALLDECRTMFHAVLKYLHDRGEIEFAAPSRFSDVKNEYQYPLKQGLKNGYKELVMRSPGRYEMALLANDSNETKKALPASCLDLLKKWIEIGIQDPSFECEQFDSSPQSKRFLHDKQQLKKLLGLVKTILSERGSNSTGTGTDSNFHLVNFSLVISTPGSEIQSWHADGGHVSLISHEPCHVFNIFVPLVDVDLSMGPTELRPGSHYYTRDLTKMMLGATARKELRPTITPELHQGDVLVFDYRILHRGRANSSHKKHYRTSTMTASSSTKQHANRTDRNHGGKDRPILVITFAKSWFVDVCNFPKRSIFDLAEPGQGDEK